MPILRLRIVLVLMIIILFFTTFKTLCFESSKKLRFETAIYCVIKKRRVLGTLHILFLIFTITLSCRYAYFIDKETGAQRGEVFLSKSFSKLW